MLCAELPYLFQLAREAGITALAQPKGKAAVELDEAQAALDALPGDFQVAFSLLYADRLLAALGNQGYRVLMPGDGIPMGAVFPPDLAAEWWRYFQGGGIVPAPVPGIPFAKIEMLDAADYQHMAYTPLRPAPEPDNAATNNTGDDAVLTCYPSAPDDWINRLAALALIHIASFLTGRVLLNFLLSYLGTAGVPPTSSFLWLASLPPAWCVVLAVCAVWLARDIRWFLRRVRV